MAGRIPQRYDGDPEDFDPEGYGSFDPNELYNREYSRTTHSMYPFSLTSFRRINFVNTAMPFSLSLLNIRHLSPATLLLLSQIMWAIDTDQGRRHLLKIKSVNWNLLPL